MHICPKRCKREQNRTIGPSACTVSLALGRYAHRLYMLQPQTSRATRANKHTQAKNYISFKHVRLKDEDTRITKSENLICLYIYIYSQYVYCVYIYTLDHAVRKLRKWVAPSLSNMNSVEASTNQLVMTSTALT